MANNDSKKASVVGTQSKEGEPDQAERASQAVVQSLIWRTSS